MSLASPTTACSSPLAQSNSRVKLTPKLFPIKCFIHSEQRVLTTFFPREEREKRYFNFTPQFRVKKSTETFPQKWKVWVCGFVFIYPRLDFHICRWERRWEESRRAEDRYGYRSWKRTEKDCVSTVHPVWTMQTAMRSYRLKHWRCVQCMHLHKQKKPIAWFFFPFYLSVSKHEFCPVLEAWTPVLVSVLEYDSEKVLFCRWLHYLMFCSPAQ